MRMECRLDVELAGVDVRRERQARDQLLRICQRWDVSAWAYTRRVIIEARAIPHSHPVLTLNTRHLRSDLDALGTFLHEEIHWGVVNQSSDAWRTVNGRLRQRYPSLPVAPPEGCGSERSNYVHLVVNYLELVALAQLVGADVARTSISQREHYRAIYRVVLEDEPGLAALFAGCGAELSPAV